MKKWSFLLLIFVVISGEIYAQGFLPADSIRVPVIDTVLIDQQNQDTTRISAFFKHSTKVIVSSLFGNSRKLSNADSLINKFDALPSFGIYKDNYIVVGSEIFKKSNNDNSDAKFQLSIRQRLTNSTLPLKTYFFLTYTQKAFWDVFKPSFPFRDLNFNPTIGLGKSLVYNNRYLGGLTVQLEHESNGKDGELSRSWNKMTFGGVFVFNDNWTLNTRVWIPIVDGQNNRDIVRYAGWGNASIDYSDAKKKYIASLMLTKRGGVNLNANVIANFAIRLFSDDNQYLFVEYYNGYGESLLQYNQYRHRLRIGVTIKSRFLNL